MVGLRFRVSGLRFTVVAVHRKQYTVYLLVIPFFYLTNHFQTIE